MKRIRAVVVDPGAPGRLALTEVEPPRAGPSQALVQVAATSLNAGELQVAQRAPAGWRPGRDLAGTVAEPAGDGSGPPAGARVVGMRNDPGVWAEQVAVATSSLAQLPDAVTFAQAATLPVAGLTALHALARGGFLLNRRVLITGSSGAVGLLAHQLATLSGAIVVGSVRTSAKEAQVRQAGADEVVVGDLSAAREHGPYHLVVDSLGGEPLAEALSMLAEGGTCVNIGWSADQQATIDVMAFNRTGGASLYGLRLDTELRGHATTQDLAGLARLVGQQRLRTAIGVEAPWREVGAVAQDVLRGRVDGKAVLHLVEG